MSKKSPSPRSPPPAIAMAAANADGGIGGGGGGSGEGGKKEGSDALTDHAASSPRMSPEPDSAGQRQSQAAPAAGSAEPDAAAVQGCNPNKC